MTDKNTMKKTEYILTVIFWTAIAIILFQFFIFIPLGKLSWAVSQGILGAFFGISVIFGTYVSYKKRRNLVSVFANIMFPLEIYTVFAYYGCYKSWITVTAIITVILSLAFFWLVMCQKTGAFRLIKKRIIHSALGVKTIVAVCLCTFVLPLLIGYMFGVRRYEPVIIKTVSWDEVETWSMANNIDTIKKIEPEIWDGLTIDERLEVLKVLKNMEMRYLGINVVVELKHEKLEEGTLGTYNPVTHNILIDSDHLKTGKSEKVLKTLLHECHHIYARHQADLYSIIPEKYQHLLMFSSVKYYGDEFENYIHGQDDFTNYAKQYIEMDAQSYAEKSADMIYESLYEYLGKENPFKQETDKGETNEKNS